MWPAIREIAEKVLAFLLGMATESLRQENAYLKVRVSELEAELLAERASAGMSHDERLRDLAAAGLVRGELPPADSGRK